MTKRKNVRHPVHAQGAAYTCVFELNENGGYTVTVPALPGIVTEGRTLDEAKKMAQEAIALHCECLIEEKRVVPPEENIVISVVHIPLLQKVRV